MTRTAAAPLGLRAFAVLWVGQFASLTGSGLSSFALGVYAYQRTGSVTTLSLVYALAYLPFVVAAPFAGALIDRWGARRSLALSNAAAATIMLLFAIVLATDTFALWQVYVVVTCLSMTEALETPALETAVPALVPKRQLGRANGMLMLAIASSRLLAPVIAGFLLLTIHLSGIVLMDCLSYALALLSIAVVRLPPHAGTEESPRPTSPAALLNDCHQAWRYITARRGLVGLLVFSAMVNFCGGVVQLMITPLVLAFASSATLGTIMSCAGVGMLAASVAMTVWGGPRRRVRGILGYAVLMGLAMVAGSLRPNPVLIAAGAFVVLGSSAIVMACNQSVWQAKVDPQLRGRVLGLLTMAFSAPPLLAFALAGFTADRVFVPLVGRSEVHSSALQLLVGTGAGRGFALLIMVMGGLIMLSALGAAASPRLWHLDAELPDVIVDQDHAADTIDTTDSTDEPGPIAASEPAAAANPAGRVMA